MIYFHSETSFQLKNKNSYKKWLKEIAKNESRRVGELNYIFCDNAYLLDINVQYLQHDTYTDIITFDYSEDNMIAGDIFISVEMVSENAKEFCFFLWFLYVFAAKGRFLHTLTAVLNLT